MAARSCHFWSPPTSAAPPIIGQAHVLYHGRFGERPEDAERTFRQLKRDAADLFDAIAAVEAAMAESCPQQMERP
jgi:hypothetical protein